MLRQLATLTRPVPAAGPRALAVAVYSDPEGNLLRAEDSGVEGVACVDDAARAFRLLCRLWEATRNPALRDWAEGLLDFVLWMREEDGRWLNFITDWEGSRNADGPTSAPGVTFWQARAAWAMADAALVLGDDRAPAALAEALAAASAADCSPDIRVIHVLAAVDVLRRAPQRRLAEVLASWCDEIVSCRSGAMLLNWPGEQGQPHLWGHVQEAALFEAGSVLERRDLQEAAVRSADAVFAGPIRSGFELPEVCAYDVQSALLVMDCLAEGTGDPRYRELGQLARGWFEGRNPAGVPTYDRVSGRVLDGVRGHTVNPASGAESNVCAGLALLDDPMVMQLARTWKADGADRTQ